MRDNILFKNPPLGVKVFDVGYFKTRHLNASAAAHRFQVQEMLRRAPELLQAAEARKAVDEVAERAKQLSDMRRKHAEGYALAMLDVLRECSEHLDQTCMPNVQPLRERVLTIINAATLPGSK